MTTDAKENDIPEVETDNEAPEKEVAESEAAEETEETEEADEQEQSEEGEEGEQAEGVAEQPAAKPRSRAEERIKTLSAREKYEREEKEKLIHDRAVLQEQLENYRRNQHAMQSAAERKAEEERLAMLDPSERAMYKMQEQNRLLEHRLNQMELKSQDRIDHANFHSKAAQDETYGKYADQVEKMYQEGLARGVSASREDLHSYILGKELKKDLASKLSKKKESASKRIDSATAKAPSAKGDVAGTKKGKSEEDRLRGVLI